MEGSRKVERNIAEQFAAEKEAPLVEVSSKDGSNIQELFMTLGKMLTEKFPG